MAGPSYGGPSPFTTISSFDFLAGIGKSVPVLIYQLQWTKSRVSLINNNDKCTVCSQLSTVAAIKCSVMHQQANCVEMPQQPMTTHIIQSRLIYSTFVSIRITAVTT